jgi:hypothetical protein
MLSQYHIEYHFLRLQSPIVTNYWSIRKNMNHGTVEDSAGCERKIEQQVCMPVERIWQNETHHKKVKRFFSFFIYFFKTEQKQKKRGKECPYINLVLNGQSIYTWFWISVSLFILVGISRLCVACAKSWRNNEVIQTTDKTRKKKKGSLCRTRE